MDDRDLKLEAVRLAVQAGLDPVNGAERIMQFIGGSKPNQPTTFQRCETADGKVYDKHSVPPFVQDAPEPASMSMSEIYDTEAMHKRGEGKFYDKPQVKTVYGNGKIG